MAASVFSRSAQRRLVLLTEGHTDPTTAKTAYSVIRYCRDEVVAVFDRGQAGRTVPRHRRIGRRHGCTLAAFFAGGRPLADLREEPYKADQDDGEEG